VTFRYNSIGAPIPARCTSQSFDNGATLPIGGAGSESGHQPFSALLPGLRRAIIAVEDRRKAPRRRILKSGTIMLGSAKVPCAVRNLSEIGACLVVQTTFGIPGTFKCVMPDRTPQTCQVIWRDDTKLGVRFQ
jgi:hypothetical protein